MEKERFTRENNLIIFTMAILCMIIGSLYDYPISKALMNSNSIFGRLGAAFGQIPASYGLCISGVLMIYCIDKKNKGAVSYIGGVFFVIVGTIASISQQIIYLNFPHGLVIVINLIVLAVVIGLVLEQVKSIDRRKIQQFIKFTLFTIIGTMLLVNVAKVIWERPRMRMLSQAEYEMLGATFQPWWQVGTPIKDKLVAVGVANEEFKSFPSGHTAGAACMLIIMAVPYLNEKYQDKEMLLFWVAIMTSVLVGLSRIIMGAHFLSDVTMGFLIAYVVTLISDKLFLKNKNRV